MLNISPLPRFAFVIVATMLTATISSAQSRGETSTYKTDEDKSRSSAGLFVEPMILASLDDGEIKTSQLPLVTDDTTARVESGGLGMRLGGHVGEVVFLAADARYNRSRFQDSFYEQADSTSYNYGATLGAQTPFFGLRVWGTSVLGGEMDPQSGVSNLDVKFRDTRGYRVGGGLHFAALAVSLEYQDLTYGNTEVQSLGSLAVNDSTDVDFSQRGTVLSVSFPIEL